MPNGPWNAGTEKEGESAATREAVLLNRETKLPEDQQMGRLCICLFRCSGNFFFNLAVIQMQMIKVKFHNQLHFNSYIYTYLAIMEICFLCEWPGMIPVDMDSNAFYVQ